MRILTTLVCFLGLLPVLLCAQAQTETQSPAKAAKTAKADKTAKAAKTAKPAKTAKANDFVRLVEVGRRAQLQTSVVRLVRPKADGAKEGQGKVVVDLLGAIHIGDESYYDKLNKRFEEYDVLLYELVLPSEEVNEIDRAQLNRIHGMQKGMQKMLGLQFQMEGIDYTPENFVHADMNMQEFLASQKKQGESFFQLYLDAVAAERKKIAAGETPRGPTALDIAGLMFSANRSMSLKLMMSRQLADMGGEFERMDGSVIISGRNKKAMAVFDAELDKGHKKIGIFYGAGHMPDFEKRLAQRGFERRSVEWLSAWNMYTS